MTSPFPITVPRTGASLRPVQTAAPSRLVGLSWRLRRWSLGVAAAPLIALGCGSGESATPGGGQGGPGGGGPRGPGGPGGRGGPPAIAPVEVATATLDSLSRETIVAGRLEPLRTVGVNAQLPGALTSVRVEEGDYVTAGQVLAQVDARDIAAQVRSAEASLVLARSTAARSERLWRDRIVTEAENQRDAAALASAEATLDQLRTRLGFASVRAPISGVITEKTVERGDVVQGQTRLFTVADVSTLLVRVQVSELEVTGIREGQSAGVVVDALDAGRIAGRVRRVFPTADTVTRMVPVEVALTGPTVRRLKPGFLARVSFELGARANVLLVPSGAVVGPNGARAVFAVRGDRAERRPVRIGESSGERVEILEGLAAGDTVVVAGADELRDGATVRVVRPVGEGANRPTPVGGTASAAARPQTAPRTGAPR
jgi:membrane fusion protein (multidrug efflux system)